MRINFETKFSIDLPQEKGEELVRAVEDFINRVAKIMPLPALTVSVNSDRHIASEGRMSV